MKYELKKETPKKTDMKEKEKPFNETDRDFIIRVIGNTMRKVFLLNDLNKCEVLLNKYSSGYIPTDREAEEDRKWLESFWY